MGFSHTATSHHFHLSSNGGTIEVTANDSADKESMNAIRQHLRGIAAMFTNGDFAVPMFVHICVPPGVTTMKLLSSKIRYQYQEIATGGRVTLQSDDPLALAGIHDFLRFQITDHETHDSLENASNP